MTPKRPSKVEQLQALSEGKGYKIVHKYGGADTRHKELFTVRKAELIEFLKNAYPFGELWFGEESRLDGFFVLKRPIGFTCYYQERCIRFGEKYCWSRDKVWEEYATYLLQVSGTGLPKEHWG